MLELTYVMIESWKKNPNSSILTPKSASESLNLANPRTSWHWKMTILGTQNLLSGRKLGIENRLSEQNTEICLSEETWALIIDYPLLLYSKTGLL